MQRPLIRPQVRMILTVSALLAPVCICILLGIAVLLEGMGDVVGGLVLRRITLAAGIVWVINLISLLLVIALNTLRVSDDDANE